MSVFGDVDVEEFDIRQLQDMFLTVDAEECERDLKTFLARSWATFDPSTFSSNWHIDAICEHLEAVNYGHLRKLLINVPPRHGKTNMVAVAWPCWTWANTPKPNRPLLGPGVRFLCTSYGSEKAQEDAVTARRLLGSEWYKNRWGNRVQITKDRDNQERYDTTSGGSRVSTGLGGAILGRGGDIKIVDDPIKTDDANSEVEINNVIRAYDEMFSTRQTDPRITAEVIIMQRLHENDLSGHVISKNLGFEHLCIPCEYEWDRHCRTSIGWSDPRGSDDEGDELEDGARQKGDGTLIWPDRFGPGELKNFKSQPYIWAGQFQQRPEPRGGGIIKPEWWQQWPPEGEEFDDKGLPSKPLNFPPFDYILASLDTALTQKSENDPSAMSVWGVWRGREGRYTPVSADGSRAPDESNIFGAGPRVMLMEAWSEHLAFHELVEKTLITCRRRRVDKLLIEGKSAGHSVMQELQRLLRGEEFGISLDVPRGDKDARLHSVVHLFSSGLVYAPVRKWSQKVKDQCSAGSKGAHDDLADTVSAALRYLRNLNEAQTQKEYEEEARSSYSYGESDPLYSDIV